MKRFILIFILLGLGLQMVYAQDADCDPAAVKEWMVQRQIGRNQLQPILDGDATISLTDALLLVQKVRRDLEDLPRPPCADKLYELTIYFYNAIGDMLGFGLNNDSASMSSVIRPRLDRYTGGVDALYLPLQTTAGVDIMTETAARGSVVPTAQPTLAPLQFQGQTGGTVIGPTDIPAGVYKLTLRGALNTSVEISAVTGKCSGFIYIAADTTSTEQVFRSDGCSILMEVNQGTTPWLVVFEPIS